ncbi:hypothetical protein DFH08DRAFT_863281 [Mycena albidolilacea]|uniref:F-box domain-containing protein n=1 Tax=Mycena albidolilacea TaxID=1033008 RepID=A0AAD7ESP5_9AGAR|nr:hypothetical protein DFH08DRAFT_863281 [Mycena albidolilacea]
MLDALAAVRSRIADIDTQILALERSLSALRTERALEQETLDSYKYPVLTAVPTEIISEIFVQFLPVYPLCPPSTGILSPTVLTQICRKWREIALETPTLWRAITLHLYNMPFDRQRHICDFLDRSGCCPLSIRSDDDLDLEPVPVVEIFAALISHRSRWEHLDILLSPSQLRAIDGPMPLLRNLHLSLDNNPDPDGIYEWRGLPLLRSVTLEEYAPSNVILPWAQLTSLTLNSIFRSEYIAILLYASNLRCCELGILWQYAIEDNLATPPEITLPGLESLTLVDRNDDWEGLYPDVFVVPALRSLCIEESFLAPHPIPALASFISKSRSKPQEVCIIGATETSDSYRTAFPAIPTFSVVPREDAADM